MTCCCLKSLVAVLSAHLAPAQQCVAYFLWRIVYKHQKAHTHMHTQSFIKSWGLMESLRLWDLTLVLWLLAPWLKAQTDFQWIVFSVLLQACNLPKPVVLQRATVEHPLFTHWGHIYTVVMRRCVCVCGGVIKEPQPPFVFNDQFVVNERRTSLYLWGVGEFPPQGLMLNC